MLLSAAGASAHVSGIDSHGHQAGQTYTALSIGGRQIAVLFTVPRALAGGDGPEEFLPRVVAGLDIRNGRDPCLIDYREADDYPAIDAWQYELHYVCDEPLGTLRFGYNLFEDEAFHTNRVEFRIGEHLSLIEMGYALREVELPVPLILAERGWKLPDEPAPLEGRVPAVTDYFVMGFGHVLTGYDHMAFLLGLMLVVQRLRSLIILITSFTIAHSITLALSGLDIATFPVVLTEAAIAFTIIYIGAENLWYLYRRRVRPDTAGFTLQRRWLTTFVFGLIHGFGFSFILREIGLGGQDLVPALLLFNLGVEAAQISAVVLPFLLIRRLLVKLPVWTTVAVVLSAGITLIGTWWLIERTLPFYT